MPLRIPPSKLSLTARSADASKRLTDWMEKSDPLISACNGLRPTITGKVSAEIQVPQKVSQCSDQEKREPATKSAEKVSEKPTQRSATASPAGSHRSDRSAPKMQEEEHKPWASKPSSRCEVQKQDQHMDFC
ncbi:protein Flattop [Hyperolius riggenbachi]|uniref:protein Flattop n=1 Tax=Hyperolius riggenbachi TaxID=752182 RepID=UPI0035A2C00C